MKFPRATGVLLHPTSLPGEFGIGDLGSAAFEFCDRLAEAGQTYWQMLPLGPTGYGDSPYQSFSAFAGNAFLISPEKLVDDGLIDQGPLDNPPAFATDRVDYGGVYHWKGDVLRSAFETFERGSSDLDRVFDEFCRDARQTGSTIMHCYRAIKMSQRQRQWLEWPDELKLRDDEALSRVRATNLFARCEPKSSLNSFSTANGVL